MRNRESLLLEPPELQEPESPEPELCRVCQSPEHLPSFHIPNYATSGAARLKALLESAV